MMDTLASNVLLGKDGDTAAPQPGLPPSEKTLSTGRLLIRFRDNIHTHGYLDTGCSETSTQERCLEFDNEEGIHHGAPLGHGASHSIKSNGIRTLTIIKPGHSTFGTHTFAQA